jgi:hypothetical protein
MRKIFLVISTLILSLSMLVPAYAANYDQRFSEVYGLSRIVDAYSPAHDLSGNDEFVGVNSKTNQPRTDGSSPHRGTDLKMGKDRYVYGVYSGLVTKVVNDSTSLSNQLGSVIINLDINGDKQPDGYYIKYLHIVPNTNLKAGSTWVDRNTIIGTIDSWKKFPPHLHFHRTTSDGVITYKLYSFYRHTSLSTWNNGEELDFLAGDSRVGNSIYITGYTMDDTQEEPLLEVHVYYKIGSGSWSDTPKKMSVYNSTYYRWTFDFNTIASPGEAVYYYLAGIRADMSSTSDRWGLWPQYYEHPPLKPSQFTSPIKYSLIILD